ncbi:hypothetical protein C8R45DRAFT_923331 [Mycena sanguinolenta]|nr:hypothetical protein C8R45DRAFT_923331 [Mycena sanguinolenta]
MIIDINSEHGQYHLGASVRALHAPVFAGWKGPLGLASRRRFPEPRYINAYKRVVEMQRSHRATASCRALRGLPVSYRMHACHRDVPATAVMPPQLINSQVWKLVAKNIGKTYGNHSQYLHDPP